MDVYQNKNFEEVEEVSIRTQEALYFKAHGTADLLELGNMAIKQLFEAHYCPSNPFM